MDGQGRILRLKQGYNPNSSSIGSTITIFFAAALSASGLTVLLLNLLRPRGQRDPAGAPRDGEG